MDSRTEKAEAAPTAESQSCHPESGLAGAAQHERMPPTLEVVCENDACELDMFELHYTYDMPDGVGVSDFSCPYCGTVEDLREVEL